MVKKYLLIASCALLLSACSSTTTSPQSMSQAKVNPAESAANYNVQLGMGYLQQGDTQRAKSKLLLALSQAPDWAPAQEAMGYFLLSTGDTKKAEQYYLRAVEINPTAGATQNNYGVYLCRMGRYQEADKHYMLATQDPNYVNTSEAYENAGLCAMQAHNNAKAMGYFQKAIAQDPKRATSYLELAQIAYLENNTSLAQQYFNNYTQLAANNMGADGLWLGIRLARKMNNQALAQQYTLELQNRYPTSNEYRQLLKATPRRMPLV
jgi:type IV pilus assembly protein PilF